MATQNRIESLDVLVDGEAGKMLLKEEYGKMIDNIQKNPISQRLKNTELSGNPTAGTVEAKRFINAASQAYGTARAAGAGTLVKGKTVTIPVNQDKEFVEELEEKDTKLLGVEGLVAKRTANQRLQMVNELDKAFFEEALNGTAFTPAATLAGIDKIIDAAIVALENTKNDYIDGIDKSLMNIICTPEVYMEMREYIDTIHRGNVDSAAMDIYQFHGVGIESCHHLPTNVKFMIMLTGSIAQPFYSNEYSAERVPLSDAVALELFFHYGTKIVTPETVLYYQTTTNASNAEKKNGNKQGK